MSSPSIWTRIGNIALWAIAAIVLVVTITYSWNQRADVQYWDGAVGNLAATLIGVIVGIPIGLQIDHWRQSQDEKKQALEHKARAKVIAALITDELKENLGRIEDLLTYTLGQHSFSSVSRDNVWRAMSDSGEIRWLDNANILQEIAIIYYLLEIVEKMNNVSYQTAMGFNPAIPRNSNDAGSILLALQEYARDIVPRLKTTIALMAETYDLS